MSVNEPTIRELVGKIGNLQADVTTLEIDAKSAILIINGNGGHYNLPTNIVNLKTGRLDYDQSEESFNVQGSGGAGGLIQGIPVYCGGYNHGYLDSCYKMGDTQPFYRMSSARRDPAYVVVNDYLWILGGYDGSSDFSTSEFVSIDDGSSHNGPNLPVSLTESCATVLQNGSVIIVGGYQNHAIADETFIYSFESATWTKGPKMNTKRRYHSCASLYDIVISTGGYDLASTEILLPTASNWISGMKLN